MFVEVDVTYSYSWELKCLIMQTCGVFFLYTEGWKRK